MGISPKDTASLQIWWMLKRIDYLNRLSSEPGKVSIYLDEKIAPNPDFEPTFLDKARIVEKIKSMQAIKTEPIFEIRQGVLLALDKLSGTTPTRVGFKITLEVDRFNECLDQSRDLEGLEKEAEEGSLIFKSTQGLVLYNGKISKLRPNSLQLRFCTALFSFPKLQAVDWSEIAERMSKEDGIEELTKKQIYDLTRRLNSKIEKDLGIVKLFELNAKTIRRLL
jgi:hypothetical protein